jgi:hypothetical protein
MTLLVVTLVPLLVNIVYSTTGGLSTVAFDASVHECRPMLLLVPEKKR